MVWDQEVAGSSPVTPTKRPPRKWWFFVVYYLYMTSKNKQYPDAFILSGLIVPILFNAAVFILAAFYPGYSHIARTVSDLGASGSPVALFQNINFFAGGIFIVLFAIGLSKALSEKKKIWGGPFLVALFGLGMFAAGALPCDVVCEGYSKADQLHFIGPTIGFPAMIAGLFVLARAFKKRDSWKRLAEYTFITAWWLLVSQIFFYVAVGGVVESLIPVTGLAQRFFVWAMFLWIFVVSLHMARIPRR